jgi:hypothetical protein
LGLPGDAARGRLFSTLFPLVISFEPDPDSLDEANLLAIEQGITLEEIATEAFAAYMAAIKAARTGDIGEL